MRFSRKVAVVTGAGSGIGFATAQRLSSEAATLVMADIRPARDATASFVSSHENVSFRQCDVSNADQVQDLIHDTVSDHGRVDILVNSAGIPLVGTVLETDEAAWDQLMSVNLKGIFLCSQAALGRMCEQGEGVIVNVASEEGLVGGTRSAAYCASKGGVIQLTRAMAVDHAKDGVRVNAVCPGPVRTPLLQAFFAGKSDVADRERSVASGVPLGRLGDPHEIAAAIAFAASSDASFMTGAVVVVDGGLTAQ